MKYPDVNGICSADRVGPIFGVRAPYDRRMDQKIGSAKPASQYIYSKNIQTRDHYWSYEIRHNISLRNVVSTSKNLPKFLYERSQLFSLRSANLTGALITTSGSGCPCRQPMAGRWRRPQAIRNFFPSMVCPSGCQRRSTPSSSSMSCETRSTGCHHIFTITYSMDFCLTSVNIS